MGPQSARMSQPTAAGAQLWQVGARTESDQTSHLLRWIVSSGRVLEEALQALPAGEAIAAVVLIPCLPLHG